MTRPSLRLRHAADPRRPARRRDHRSAGAADLPDGRLRLRGLAACGGPVRPQPLRQHLHPHRQPDQRRLRGAHGDARGRSGGARDGVGHVGHRDRDADARVGRRRHRLLAAPLRRHAQPVLPAVAALRRRRALRRPARPRCRARRDRRAHARALRRDDRQPAHRRARHRGLGADRRGRRPAARDRQHVRDAVPLPAVRARRAHRRALGHQVHRRARHVDRRRDRRLGALRLGARPLPRRDRALARLSRHALLRDVRQLRVHHQGACRDDARLRPGALTVQRVPAAAGPGDALAAHAPARRERARAGRLPARPPPRALRQLPRRSPARPTTPPRSATCRSGRAPFSPSASRAGARPAGASSRPASCARTSRTSATRRRS